MDFTFQGHSWSIIYHIRNTFPSNSLPSFGTNEQSLHKCKIEPQIKTVCLALKTPALLYGEKLAHTRETKKKKNEPQSSDLDTLPGIQLENRWIQGKATRRKIRALRGNHPLGACNVQGETGHLVVPAVWRGSIIWPLLPNQQGKARGKWVCSWRGELSVGRYYGFTVHNGEVHSLHQLRSMGAGYSLLLW